MTWPWVSRLAFDTVAESCVRLVGERDWLREQLAAAIEHNRRMERVEAGRPEVPIVHRQPREPMPTDISEAIGAWDSEETKGRLMADAYRSYERTGSWDLARTTLSAYAGDE